MVANPADLLAKRLAIFCCALGDILRIGCPSNRWPVGPVLEQVLSCLVQIGQRLVDVATALPGDLGQLANGTGVLTGGGFYCTFLGEVGHDPGEFRNGFLGSLNPDLQTLRPETPGYVCRRIGESLNATARNAGRGCFDRSVIE